MTCWLYGSRATSIGVFCAISAFSRARPIEQPPEHRHYAQGIGAEESEQRLDQQVRLDERLIEIHDEGPFDVRWLETDYRLAAGAGNLVHDTLTHLVASLAKGADREAGAESVPAIIGWHPLARLAELRIACTADQYIPLGEQLAALEVKRSNDGDKRPRRIERSGASHAVGRLLKSSSWRLRVLPLLLDRH